MLRRSERVERMNETKICKQIYKGRVRDICVGESVEGAVEKV